MQLTLLSTSVWHFGQHKPLHDAELNRTAAYFNSDKKSLPVLSPSYQTSLRYLNLNQEMPSFHTISFRMSFVHFDSSYFKPKVKGGEENL
jgi:hypothetical protein